MKLFYCFNGLYDYEYSIEPKDVIVAIYKTLNIIIEEKAVDFYYTNYNEMVTKYFTDVAYWEFLQEARCDLLDDRKIKRYKRIVEEEDKMLYGRNK
jgi:hypothetical protein